MLGQMQQHPLLISSIIDFAARHHGASEVVSRRVEGDIHRTNYRSIAERARQVAQALDALGLAPSTRVATLAWNGYRHLELYFGVSASGRVLHTLNPRLHPDQIEWIVSHAQDQVLCFDLSFLPIVQTIHARCPQIRQYVALCDAQRLPADSGVPNLVAYESWIAAPAPAYVWPDLDENSASSLCYTSGTTGHPKGVLYSHRSSMLHALSVALPDAFNISARDSVLAVVPMFHVNAWGLPYMAPMTGAKLVFPGPALDGKSVFELMQAEQVSFAAGVPTVWQMLLAHVQEMGLRFSTLKRTAIGGSACPPAMIQAFQEEHGVEVLHAWGMTETSPVGTAGALKNHHLELDTQAQLALRAKQGRVVYGIDIKVVSPEGAELPWDASSYGDLMIRGPWVIQQYYGETQAAVDADGWFPTGDVATIDADGFMQITDRSKDVIKSGGEWISSIAVENVAMAHPAVAMAACIGMKHPKWDERPVIVVVRRAGMALSRDEVLQHYAGKMAKWQIPDDVIFLDSIPLGGTGKMQKSKLRELLSDYRLPGT